MSKIKLTFVAAAICGGLLALAPMCGAFAAPIAPIGKAANAIDSRSVVYYDGYYRRHYRHYGYYHRPYYRHYGYYHGHYRHCWWRYGRRICRW
jgi:hypothetical protein